MKKKRLLWSVVVASLVASSASAVPFYVPVPNLGGNYVFRTEFVRQDFGKGRVEFTYVAEGRSGLGLPPQTFTVLPGPSTSLAHPLLTDNVGRDYRRPPDRSDPKWFLPAAGLVIMEGEPGLVGAETGVVIGNDPTAAWELPMLTKDDAFPPGDTAYVLNLMKDGVTASELSLYNLDGSPALCNTRLLSAKGRVLDERFAIPVPSFGAARVANVLSKVTLASVANMSVAVTCDHAFYALGSFPSPSIGSVRVHYPSPDPPTNGALQPLVHNPGFKVTRDNSVLTFDLPLEPNKRYRSLTIDFDVAAAAPPNSAFYRGLLGMWRNEPGQRFGKTLFFGVNERFDRSKLLIDLGTPYIEVMIKTGNAAFVGGRNYHFHLEVNSDQRSIRQLVTLPGGGVLADMRSGLFNEDLMNRDGNTLTLGFGLPGIGDGAYSPPYGWRFSNIIVNGYK